MSPAKKSECAGLYAINSKIRFITLESLGASCHGEATHRINDQYYCVMHAPTEFKEQEFRAAILAKLAAKDYNFCGVQFLQTESFANHTFENEVDFRYARFGKLISFAHVKFLSGANFQGARLGSQFTQFENVQFKTRAYFNEATFHGSVKFDNGIFSGETFFGKTEFDGTVLSFKEATFKKYAHFEAAECKSTELIFDAAKFQDGVNFEKLKFRDNAFASFRRTKFADSVRFQECEVSHNAAMFFGKSMFEKPERVNFHSMNDLEPAWFINVDTHEFNFEGTEFRRLKRYNPTGRQLALAGILLDRIKDEKQSKIAA